MKVCVDKFYFVINYVKLYSGDLCFASDILEVEYKLVIMA